MRLAATACAGALVACVAVAGAVLAQKSSLLAPAPAPEALPSRRDGLRSREREAGR